MPPASDEGVLTLGEMEASFQPPVRAWPGRRWLAAIAGAGAAAYACCLLVTFPAGIAFRLAGAPEAWRHASGTVWKGSLLLDSGVLASWRASPLRMLVTLSAAGDLTLTGQGTDLTARMEARPSWLQLEEVRGRAGASFVAALAKSLPFRCETAMRVDLVRLVFGGSGAGASGEVRSERGTCTSAVGATPLPALRGVAAEDSGGPVLSFSPVDQPSVLVAQMRWRRDGSRALTIFPAGSTLLSPGSPPRTLSLEIGR